MTPYKNRKCNPHLPVQVYKNIHKKGYSIRQEGLVVGHTEDATILDGEFIVREPGRQRTLRHKVKNVHAWVEGTLQTTRPQIPLKVRISYNPYKNSTFVDRVGNEIRNARLVVLRWDGVTAWRINDW